MHCIAAGTTIAIQGNRWRPQAAKQEGNEVSITFPWSTWKERLERPNVRGFSIDSTSRNGAPFRKGGVAIDGETTEQATNEYLPPLPPQNSPLPPTHTHYFSYSRAHLPHRRAASLGAPSVLLMSTTRYCFPTHRRVPSLPSFAIAPALIWCMPHGWLRACGHSDSGVPICYIHVTVRAPVSVPCDRL